MHVGVNRPQLVPATQRPFSESAEPKKPESASYGDSMPKQGPLIPVRSIHDPGPTPAHVCQLLFGKEVGQNDYTRELTAARDVPAVGQQLVG